LSKGQGLVEMSELEFQAALTDLEEMQNEKQQLLIAEKQVSTRE
jgi:hypothetical protein